MRVRFLPGAHKKINVRLIKEDIHFVNETARRENPKVYDRLNGDVLNFRAISGDAVILVRSVFSPVKFFRDHIEGDRVR